MSICVELPEDLAAPPPDAVPEPDRQPQHNLWRFRFPWVKTAVGAPADDEELRLENMTGHTWILWHRFHALGTISPHSERRLRLVKAGMLSARRFHASDEAYILVHLVPSAQAVRICDVSGGEGFYDLELLAGPEGE